MHYRHIQEWAGACILLIFNIRIISHCRSLFSCFLMCFEILVQPRADDSLFHNPSLPTHASLSRRASARSLLGIPRERQLRNEAPVPRNAVCPRGAAPMHRRDLPVAASTPPAPFRGCRYHSEKSRQEEQSCQPNC